MSAAGQPLVMSAGDEPVRVATLVDLKYGLAHGGVVGYLDAWGNRRWGYLGMTGSLGNEQWSVGLSADEIEAAIAEISPAWTVA